MKTCLTMRTTLVLGLPAVARGLERAQRWRHDLLSRAGHEAGRGNVVTACGLLLLYAVGL